MNSPLRRAGLALTVALSLLAAGCATTQTDAKSGDAKVTTEYDYVMVTGSHVPVKVPRNGKPLPSANQVTNMSAENFEQVVQQGLRDSPGKN